MVEGGIEIADQRVREAQSLLFLALCRGLVNGLCGYLSPMTWNKNKRKRLSLSHFAGDTGRGVLRESQENAMGDAGDLRAKPWRQRRD